ncbi:MAG: response regulator [Verrucomicrobia bacterium]|jgi:signal transduction histidine kinase/CheY-like chemotaxis protein|nr:response regulator [Verrucomicrobiota bacterium]
MKSDVIFDFENAAWPALLVDGAGEIVRANHAATNTFGPPLTTDSARLAALWSADNCLTVEKFLKDGAAALAPLTPLKLLLPTGPKTFSALVGLHAHHEKRFLLLQLLPDTSELAGTKPAALDAGLVHKQKLDCALQLARSVALDFNNALTSVLGYTSLMLSKAEAAHPWRRTLLEIEKSAAKAAEVAADLAAFSLQEKEPRAQAAGNVNVILQRCVEFFQNSRKEPTAWNIQLDRRLFAAKFDEAKIQQAFMKVLENAVESLKENGRIGVQTRNVELAEPTQDRNARLAAGSYVCTEISDNGSGIEPDVLPRIFEPFFTTKKGTHRGLGLAWVYGIVTNHGGGVAVSSQPDVGTSVRVYLPAEKNIVKDSTQAGDDLTGNQTILMVDDEDLLLTMGETILSSYGYRVFTANSGQKALEIISKSDKPIDLVITDLVMPIMSGRELVEQLRRLSPSTRILSISGYVWPGSKQEATTYLQKPFTTQELLMKVKHVLGPT